jgi:hypothetical protein
LTSPLARMSTIAYVRTDEGGSAFRRMASRSKSGECADRMALSSTSGLMTRTQERRHHGWSFDPCTKDLEGLPCRTNSQLGHRSNHPRVSPPRHRHSNRPRGTTFPPTRHRGRMRRRMTGPFLRPPQRRKRRGAVVGGGCSCFCSSCSCSAASAACCTTCSGTATMTATAAAPRRRPHR